MPDVICLTRRNPVATLLAVEGLDGSGKTTVAGRVARSLGFQMIRLSDGIGDMLSDSVAADFKSTARYAAYLARALHIHGQVTAGHAIVSDRYRTSAHALHVAALGPTADALRRVVLPPADLEVCLVVAESERRRRLRSKAVPLDPFEIELEKNATMRTEVLEQMASRSSAQLTIDTTRRTVEAVVESVVRAYYRNCLGRDSATGDADRSQAGA